MTNLENKTLDELRDYLKELSTTWQKVVTSLVESVDFRCRSSRKERPFQLFLDHTKSGKPWYSNKTPYQIKLENEEFFHAFWDWFYNQSTNFDDIAHWKNLSEIHSGSIHTLKAKRDMAQSILTVLNKEEKRIENEINSLTQILANIDRAHDYIQDICGKDYE